MAGRPIPDGVEVADFGIRGVHLAYQLLDGYDVLVLVDAAPRGHAPGTVTLVEVDQSRLARRRARPWRVVRARWSTRTAWIRATCSRMLAALGGTGGDACSSLPASLRSIEEGIGLSATVQAAVPDAVALVEQVMQQNDGSPKEVTTS